jgi:hypothetical protein
METYTYTQKKIYITENELNNLDLTHSNIKECVVKKEDELISTNKKK